MIKSIFFLLPLLFLNVTEIQQNPPANQAIAKAHGLDNWKDVNEIAFTFNVDRDTNHFDRSFIWKPKTGMVTYITENDTLTYNHNNPKGEKEIAADQAFINDKYWLLAPFQLVWDTGATFSEVSKAKAPISNEKMNKLTMVYPSEGGYTPGDAYDFYFNDDYILQEWVYRQGNQAEPSMTTTWEGYQEINGIKLSTEHKMGKGDFHLYFTDVSIK